MKYSDMAYSNYLKHYGVLGMKWGVHKYQKSDGTLTEAGKKRYGDRFPDHIYKSWATKHNEKKAAQSRAKGNEERALEYERRARRSSELDRREEQYAKRVNAGANVVLRILTGNRMGGKTYQTFLAMMNGTDGGAMDNQMKKAIAFIGSSLAPIGGRALAKAIYIRSGSKT